MVKFFWDTYALILLLQGDERVLPYIDENGITSTLNIAELCAYLLRNRLECENIAYRIRETFTLIERIPLSIAVESAKLRHKMRESGKQWSYVDAIGYLLATKTEAKFLTGDKEFKDIENVEFIE